MEAPGQAGSTRHGGDGYRFGPFVVDCSAYTLTRDGEPQALEPKAFAVLLHLLRHAGELVRHDELLDAVWGHRHVTPGVLTRAVAPCTRGRSAPAAIHPDAARPGLPLRRRVEGAAG